MGLLERAKSFLRNVRPDATVADFTMGNGNDTAFLCALVPQGRVYAFDVQEEALQNTRALLRERGLENAVLIRDGHENLKRYLPGPIAAGMFNLGYRPGSDHTVHTRPETTLRAVTDAMELLEKGGVLVICVYPGDEIGAAEGETLCTELSALGRKRFCVLCCRMLNAADAPYIIIVEKY